MISFKNFTVLAGISLVMFVHASVCSAAGVDVTAKAAIVVEARTGKVLYAKDAETRRYPASTTKMMTLIVALEKGDLKDIVTASRAASETEGSTMFLEDGERLELLDLLYGIMLVSGNDATVAVAEHIAGSVSEYAKLMTVKAHEIGAVDTNFANSSGLPDPNHYTTAHDLARIAAYGYKNPMFAHIVGTKERVMPGKGKKDGRKLQNENQMLWLYEGANGVKTGYTNAAGRCLVSAAKRGGVQLIAVVLDSEYMWNDSMALLNYGFDNIRMKTFLRKGEVTGKIDVSSGKKDAVYLETERTLAVPVANGERSDFKTVIDAPRKVDAPVYRGQKIGRARLLYGEAEVASVDLVATEDVEIKSFFRTLRVFFSDILNGLTRLFR